jgi:DNA polymerase III epsilon subunit-like protein
MSSSLQTSHLLAIDIETGGLDPARHPILSFAAHPEWNQQPFYRLVLPPDYAPIEPEAVAVNGYEWGLWKKSGAAPIAQVLNDFRVWIHARPGSVGSVAPVAHNAGFDRAFLDSAYRRLAMTPMLAHRWECSQATLLAARRAGIIGPGSSSLDALADLSGQQRPAIHAADVDARVCLRGYQWLLRRMQPGFFRRLINRLPV